MKRLDKDTLRDTFAEAVSAVDSSLITNALTGLSAALHELQRAGIDVDLMLTGCAGEMGFEMNLGNNIQTWTQRTGGILRICNSQHLVAISDQVKLKSDGAEAAWKPCILLAISRLDIRFQGMDKAIRTHVYQLHEHSEDLMKLQEFIIQKAAVDMAFAKADTHHAFTNAQPGSLSLIETPRSGKIPLAKKS